MDLAAGGKNVDGLRRDDPVPAVSLQNLADVRVGDLATLLKDSAELLKDFEPAADVLVVALQPQFVAPQHHVDAQGFAHFSQVFITGSEQSSDFILIGKRECRF
jgi:hypothetical protein